MFPSPFATGRPHTDSEYHHQPAEINWWLPLSDEVFGGNTLHVSAWAWACAWACVPVSTPLLVDARHHVDYLAFIESFCSGSKYLTPADEQVESKPGLRDFHPLNLKYGQVCRFYGNKCTHFCVPNDTAVTRVLAARIRMRAYTLAHTRSHTHAGRDKPQGRSPAELFICLHTSLCA